MSGRTPVCIVGVALLLVCAGLGPAAAQAPAGGDARPVTKALPPGTEVPRGTLAVPESTVIPGAGGVVTKGGGALGAGPAPASAPAASGGLPANDYPTVARADYVFACMQVNGQTRDILEKCSCSIDAIAALLPYADYEEAETIMSVRQRGGKIVGLLEYGPAKEKVATMKRAQVEGELRCF